MSRATGKLVRRSTANKTSRPKTKSSDEKLTPQMLRAFAAQLEAAARKKPQQLELPAAAPSVTFGDFAPRWLARYAATEGLAPSTVGLYEKAMRLTLMPTWRERRLADITTDDVEGWVAAVVKSGKWSRRTFSARVTLFGQIMQGAKRQKLMMEMPEVAHLSFKRGERPWLNEEEFEILVEAAEELGAQTLAVVLLGGDAGLRAGEILGLLWTDFEDGVIVVRHQRSRGVESPPKHDKRRRVPMTARLAKCLEKVRRETGAGAYVFNEDGRPRAEQFLDYRLTAALERSELGKQNITMHSLRHTFITHLDARGQSASVIQRLVGHASIATTQLYLHVDEDRLLQAIAKLRKK